MYHEIASSYILFIFFLMKYDRDESFIRKISISLTSLLGSLHIIVVYMVNDLFFLARVLYNTPSDPVLDYFPFFPIELPLLQCYLLLPAIRTLSGVQKIASSHR